MFVVCPRGLASVLLIGMSIVTTHLVAQKPTREQIIEFGEKCEREKVRMDLVAEFGSDFSGLDLSGVNFRGYYYVNNETFIRGVNFRNCNLENAQFGSAILDGSDFTGANLNGASFITGSLKNVVLVNVSLDGTRFYQSDLSGANLAKVDLSSADITGSNFAGSDLSSAVLSGANEEYGWIDFRKANLTGADLSGLNLRLARFQNAVLRSADLSGAKLVQADFTGADLTATSFDNCDVESALFQDVQGLSPEQKSELESQAQRWKFELKVAISWFLEAAHFPTYILVVILLVGLTFVVLLSPPRSVLVMVDACVNAFVIVPPCIMLRLFASGGGPTAQMNAGDPGAMEAWSTWVHLFPPLMIGLLVCLGVSIIVAIAALVSCIRRGRLRQAITPLIYVALTVVHCLFATHWVGINFPNA